MDISIGMRDWKWVEFSKIKDSINISDYYNLIMRHYDSRIEETILYAYNEESNQELYNYDIHI